MSIEPYNVSQLLSPRQQKHIGARVVAEAIDFALFIVACVLLTKAVGELTAWSFYSLLILYFTLLEWRTGQTIGKSVMNLRVVNDAGHLPSFGQALIRNLIRPLEGFGTFGIIAVVLTGKGQRVGDLLASTYVVRGNELQELASFVAGISTNRDPKAREVIPITPEALELAKSQIAASYRPNETGLSVLATSSLSNGFSVQLDFVDPDDDCWRYTTSGVTISVPQSIADRCLGFQINALDGKLVVDRAT